MNFQKKNLHGVEYGDYCTDTILCFISKLLIKNYWDSIHYLFLFFFFFLNWPQLFLAQLAGGVEYAACIFAEE